jgi:hypothetical protein
MADNTTTTFENKCGILSDLWLEYREDEVFKDFVVYNDLGLPLAYAIENKMVTPLEQSVKMIDETFMLLLAALEVDEDTGFETLDDLLVIIEE